MVTVKDEEYIEVSEILTFSGTVQKEYDKFIENEKDELEMNEGFDQEEDKNIRKFLNYKLTHDDKIAILESIVAKYEIDSNYYDNLSIFDEDLISNCLKTWIEEKFEITII